MDMFFFFKSNISDALLLNLRSSIEHLPGIELRLKYFNWVTILNFSSSLSNYRARAPRKRTKYQVMCKFAITWFWLFSYFVVNFIYPYKMAFVKGKNITRCFGDCKRLYHVKCAQKLNHLVTPVSVMRVKMRRLALNLV